MFLKVYWSASEMPKIPSSVKVEVRSYSDPTSVLGEVELPIFCVEHMKMTPPETNLATMIRHVESRVPNLKIGEVFIEGQSVSGLTAQQVQNGISLTVKVA